MRPPLHKILFSVTLTCLGLLGASLVVACDVDEGFDGEAREVLQAVEDGDAPEEVREEIEEATRHLTPPKEDLSARLEEVEDWLTTRRQARDTDPRVLASIEADLREARAILAAGGASVGEEVEVVLLRLDAAMAEVDLAPRDR